MLTSRTARRQTFLFVALLAAAILMLAFSSSAPLNEVRRGVGFAMSPIQNVMRNGARTFGSLFATIGEIERLRQLNDQLTQRLNELEATNRGLESLRVQNEQLTEILNVRSALDYETVAAEVISRRMTAQERVISLGTGSEAGIRVGDPVVAGGGALVGQVDEVGERYSRVLLISDSRFFVAGLTEVSRGIGDVQGQAERPLNMTRIAATDPVSVGESVLTAGIELAEGVRSPYPKGLLIGTIVEVERSPDQLFQTALVQPAAPLERLEYVLVITNYEGGLPGLEPEPTESPTP
jgi:rod shape-determining protein MreC